MKSWTLAAAPLLLSSAHALPEIAISKRDRHTNGATNIFARGVTSSSSLKRAGVVTTNIFDVESWSLGGAYYANITVGTPPQEQTVIVDTGSSDLYFDASTARTCQEPEDDPDSCQGGTFDHSKSDTYNEVAPSPSFNTSFGDGSTAYGPYGSDYVGIGDVVISNVQFGVADTVDSTTGYSIGLMGVGYSANEAVTTRDDFYPNMPEVLVDAGVINSRLYSVYLNDAEAISGTILFGGIDKSKYTGDLATINLLPVAIEGQVTDFVLEFITTVTSAKTTVGGKSSTLWSGGRDGISAYTDVDNDALPVLLDTGSTAWSLPTRQYNQIVSEFTYVDNQGTCACSHAESGDTITLEFAGQVPITIDASQFIVPYIDSVSRKPIPYNGGSDDTCVFLITPGQSLGTGFQTLGDAILRSMYVVYDLDNGQVSIAQAKLNSDDEPDIVTVQAGPTGVAAAASISAVAPDSSLTIAPKVSATNSFVASTAASTIGTATGEGAIPTDAQVVGTVSGVEAPTNTGSSGGDSADNTASPSPSQGAASGLVVPGADHTGFWVAGTWVALAALGAGLMM